MNIMFLRNDEAENGSLTKHGIGDIVADSLPQGQRTLFFRILRRLAYSEDEFHEEIEAPAGEAAFADEAVFGRVTFE